MNAIKRAYGALDPTEKEHYVLLLTAEINSYLDSIYKAMKPETHLKPARFRKESIKLLVASLGATKSYEFRPKKREDAAHGDVGNVVVVTRCLKDPQLRKQTALFIAAEQYTYHAFANHPDPKYYKAITGQNQYIDMIKKVSGIRNAHELRDIAARYIIGEIGEYKLAQHSPKNWHVSIAKIKHHDAEMARVLGSSEKTFKKILRQQKITYTPKMLVTEDTLLKKELDDIRHLISLIKAEMKERNKQYHKLMKLHLENLELFEKVLGEILKNIESWEVVDKKEHALLKKKVVSMQEIQRLLKEEAAAEKIDINKVHILFRHFEKEKLNILKDLEIFSNKNAKPGVKKT